MGKKIYVVKNGECGMCLTASMCLGTNDTKKYPVRDGKPLEVVALFKDVHEEQRAHITADPIEIEMITKYLSTTQNPFFYDVDDPEGLTYLKRTV